ncbi:hypothetical protein PoB_006614200 [Plakobranchus ocellatus]|uniref:Uncharacterized protein n=1 Tax=Plakobranchus ocellatus TaxID=259542 RepID=A0AAV4D696_9GAST|nr:hypothetical protein PoB_006614200 [Plakobranchus ocellatus]
MHAWILPPHPHRRRATSFILTHGRLAWGLNTHHVGLGSSYFPTAHVIDQRVAVHFQCLGRPAPNTADLLCGRSAISCRGQLVLLICCYLVSPT